MTDKLQSISKLSFTQYCTLKTEYRIKSKVSKVCKNRDKRIERFSQDIREKNRPRARHARRVRIPEKEARWSSKKERRVDALALRAEERRDKLRKATGSCK